MIGGGGRLPWGAGGGSQALRGGRAGRPGARIAALAAILLGIALLGWLTYGRLCGGDDCVSVYCPSDRDIAAPDGYEFASRIFELNPKAAPTETGFDVQVQAALIKPATDGRMLSFFRYDESAQRWEPVAPAVLDAQGRVVTGTLKEAPQVIAVLRRNTPAGEVVAYLPHNATLNPQAAPHVTIVHPLDFAPLADGSIGGELSRTVAPNAGYEVYPVIAANASVQGQVAVVESLLADARSRTNHVQQIVAKVNEFGLNGIDIAYLDLPATQRTSFTLFIGELAEVLHQQGKKLTVTLPSPIKTQNRIDEGAYDYQGIAERADLVKIAPYRDQATYRLVMPEVLQSLVERVPPSKLVLTVSPYATETGGETINRLTLVDAMNIATRISIRAQADAITTSTQVDVAGTNIDRDEGLTGLRWYPETATVAFSYKQPQGGGSRTVYIENVFSIGFKLELIPTYRLGGVAIEDASENVLLGDIWPAVIPFVTSGLPTLQQPNAEDLKPRWAVSGGKIEDTGRGSARWFTPAEPGSYTVTLTLSDGAALFENSVEVVVRPRQSAATPTPATGN
jgi:spore germination protein YaaH